MSVPVLYDSKRLSRDTAADTAADAARLGDELRDARLTLGLSIEDVAARLRIRRVHLEALEEGRLRELPGTAYALGFVRSYATALGLDPDSMARRFRELTAAAAKPVLAFPEPVPERGLPTGTIATVGAVAAIGLYVAWFNWSNGTRSVDAVPPVPPRLEAAAEAGRTQLPVREAMRTDPGPLPLAALPPPGGLPPTGPNTSAQAATVPAMPAPVAVPPAPAPAPAIIVAPPPAAVAPPTVPGVPDGTRIVLRARANSGDGAWIQVREPRSGAVLVNRVLKPGEAWPAPVRDGLLLDTGKADGLEVLVDGQAQPTLDGLVGVRRNIALEPDRLRQRIVPATAAAPAPRN